MNYRHIYFSLILSFMLLIPLFGQDSSVSKFDPFLQRELKSTGDITLLRQAQPGVPSQALSKLLEIDEPLYNVIFHGDDRAFDDLGIRFNTRLPGIATARVSLYDLLRAGYHSGIRQIEIGGEMTVNLDRSVRRINAHRVHEGEIMNVPFRGRDVIIGIIDTGIDIFHPDFRDTLVTNASRVLSMWDVRLDPEGDERNPENFDYGVEYTRNAIELELRGETQGAIRSADVNGHGTHVAGIIGGNGMKSNGWYTGVAPEAEFIVVSFTDGRFFPAEVVDAMNYIFTKADELGRPAVVNLSIGGHGGAHDGTAGHEQVITFYSQRSGKAITAAAGNSGNREIHYGQSLTPREESEFNLRIPDYSPDLINNDNYVLKYLWYESTDIFEVTVTSPNGFEVSVQSGDSVMVSTPDGAIELDTFDNFANPKNARVFFINIHTTNTQIPPKSGDWKINVHNRSGVSSGKYNSWIISSSMDNPRPVVQPNTGREYTVTIPGTAEGAITAGAFTSRREWTSRNGQTWHFPDAVEGNLASFSGGGPTRDGRTKPNITSPGQIIGSAKSRDVDINDPNFQEALLLPRQGYWLLQGTSMASPHIAGMAAIIFEANPDLTGKQLLQILEQSGQSDGYTGSIPNNEWGFGKTNAIEMFDHFEITHGIPDEFYLYQNFPNPFNAFTTIRFTIPEATSGELAVYDILGRKVEVLIEGELDPRIYTLTFAGSGLSSGVYFYRLETEAFTNVHKMILLR